MGAFAKIALWSVFYFGVIGRLMLTWLTVSPFRYPYFIDAHAAGGPQWGWRSPFQDCVFLWDQFVSGPWKIDSLPDVGLLLIFVLYYPVWAGICLLLYHSSSTKETNTFATSQDAPKNQFWGEENMVSRRPRPLPQGMHNASMMDQKTVPAAATTTPALPAVGPGASAGSSEVAPETPPEADNKRVRDVLLQLAQKHDLALYDNLALSSDDPVVPFSLALDNCAFLCDVVDNPDAEWIPDDACDPQETAYWFSAVQQVPSPFQKLAKQAKKLSQEDIGDSPVYAVVILVSGTIVGADALIPVWREKGGMVVRLDESVACPDLPLLSDYVEERLEALSSTETSSDEEEETSEEDDSWNESSEETVGEEQLSEEERVAEEPVRIIEGADNADDTTFSETEES